MRCRIAVLAVACGLSLPLVHGGQPSARAQGEPKASPEEFPVKRIPNLGEAAEAYFSPDGKSLIGTAKLEGDTVHHVTTWKLDGTDIRRINDKGLDACSYFFPDGKKLIWTSTRDHLDLPAGNWSDPKSYPTGAELYTSNLDGSNVVRLTNNLYYDAEVSVSPDGKWILFGRQIDGKMDLWRMRSDGTGEQQVTKTPDWQEGGAFYMPDSETIIYRAWKITDEGVRGLPMTIYTIKHDGTGQRQITHEPGTNWAPHPAPDGKHFTFVKMLPPSNFEVFVMNIETGDETRLTYNEKFDGFPAFSPDGKTIAFASGRDTAPGERKLYLYTMDVSSLRIKPLKAPVSSSVR